MPDITALGELLIDFALKETDTAGYPTMAAHPGGAPANFLAALAKYGFKTALIGKVGQDTFGKLLVNTLKNAGIETRGIVMDDSVFTTLSFVTFDVNGDREFSFARKPGADTQLRFDEVVTELIDESRIFHFGTLSLTDEPSRETTVNCVKYAKSLGKTITFDPNLRKPLWRSMDEAKEQMLWGLENADIVKISDDEAEFLFPGSTPEEVAQIILDDFGAKLVFVTLGKEGALFMNNAACGRVPNYADVTTIDTTGAGDIFGGSAISMILKTGKAPEELTYDELYGIASFACTAASLSTEKPGGIPSIPDYDTVIGAMNKK